MSYEVPGHKLGTLFAGADLTAAQFHFVKIHPSGRIVLCAVAGEASVGVLQNKPLSGQACEIDRDGVSKLVMGAAVTAGDPIATDVSGQGVTATSGQYVGGMVLETVAASGSIGAVAQRFPGRLA